jgi:rhodanese-related sulfurtransferase
MSRRTPFFISLFVVIALVIGACGGAPAAAPVAPDPTATSVPAAPEPTEAPAEEAVAEEAEEAEAIATEEPAEEAAEEAAAEPTAEPTEEAAEEAEAEPAAEPTEEAAEEAAEETDAGDFDLVAEVDAFMSAIPEGFSSVGRLDAFLAILDSGQAVIIDVREVAEYEAGHVPGAINIPIREVAKNLELIPADMPVVIYCASGHRASIAVASLRMLGYDNVRGFPGGWKAWSDAGEEGSTEATIGEPVEAKEVSADMLAAVDGFLSAIPEGFYSIGTVDRLADAVDAGAFLVDVREPTETAEGVIPDALELPIRTVVANLDQIPTDQQVIVYCASGWRAGMTLTALQMLGYSNVRSFPPGYGAWESANGQ